MPIGPGATQPKWFVFLDKRAWERRCHHHVPYFHIARVQYTHSTEGDAPFLASCWPPARHNNPVCLKGHSYFIRYQTMISMECNRPWPPQPWPADRINHVITFPSGRPSVRPLDPSQVCQIISDKKQTKLSLSNLWAKETADCWHWWQHPHIVDKRVPTPQLWENEGSVVHRASGTTPIRGRCTLNDWPTPRFLFPLFLSRK